MPTFRPLSDGELDARSSDELIAYIRAADAAGNAEAAERGLAILVFRHIDDVKRRVAIKVPAPDVEDVAMEVITSAIRSAFDGTAIGQFMAWLNKIVKFRIADYWRRREREPKSDALPEEHGEAEEIWGEAARIASETGAVDVQSIIDHAQAQLSEIHRKVVDLYVFQDLSAQEAAEAINHNFNGHPELSTPMTNDNVHQIAKRFRDSVRGLLDEAER